MTTPTNTKPSYFIFDPTSFDESFDNFDNNTELAVDKAGEVSRAAFSNSKYTNVVIDVSTSTSKKITHSSISFSKKTCQSSISTSDTCCKLADATDAAQGRPVYGQVLRTAPNGIVFVGMGPTGEFRKPWKD